jgi:palmitoyl-protein thioesterase
MKMFFSSFSHHTTLSPILLLLLRVAIASSSLCREQEWEDHPTLCRMVDRAENDVEALAVEMHEWARAHGMLVEPKLEPKLEPSISMSINAEIAKSRNLRRLDENQLPVVLAHGMGDSCFNDGMQHITAKVSEMLGGVYTVCVPTGETQSEDTKNGYFLSMNANVDLFAEGVRQDPNLQKGFHAIGFSQGNNVIRGYIARMNEPAVNTFISINGVNAGIGAVPYCRPELTGSFSMCDLLMETASHRAYTDFAQEHSFQANYWRDPRPSMQDSYHRYSQLAVWNNEAAYNETLKENYAKTQAFVWVLATEDGMVWPKEGEHWGAPDPQDPYNHILPMEETEWYTDDLFGLRTAQEAGKNYFESFQGDHLQFTMEDFEKWVNAYLTPK